MYEPDILRVAVTAAGGTNAVAAAFGLSAGGVSTRVAKKFWPAADLRRLCEMGGNIITVERLLDYLEQAQASTEASNHGG